MRNPKNPFLVVGYHSPKYFCNRNQELNWLFNQFHNERNAVLYGYRRMGKTALIRHFFYHLHRDKLAKTIYVDLLGTTSLAEANQKLAENIINQLGRLKNGLSRSLLSFIKSIGANISLDPFSGMPQLAFTYSHHLSPEKALEAIGQYLKSFKEPVVIAVDEFQQISHYKEPNIEATFRAWVQEFPMIRFIFSGSNRSMICGMFSEHNRPFYGSAELFSLEEIKQSEYQSFIQSHYRLDKIPISEELIQRIFIWTRMQTYYLQLVFNKLYGVRKKPDEDLLNEIFMEILQQQAPLFATYQYLLTDFQWRTLMAIAQAERVANPTSKQFLLQYKLGAASSVSSAVGMLTKKEFLVNHEGSLQLHDTLLMRWLQNL